MTTNYCLRISAAFNCNCFHGLIILVACFSSLQSGAQSYDGLNNLKGHQTQVYYSNGAAAKAQRIAGQLDKVIGFYEEQLKFKPSVTLLVLSPQDWSRYSQSVVYGMPHYTDAHTLIVASENNAFWKSFIPPTDKLPGEQAADIIKTYTGKDGQLSMEPFFDLLAIHELGHAYHEQAGLQMQRSWMGELFVNIFLHSYIASKEPALLPALTSFPKMVVSLTNRKDLKYTSLNDLEKKYDELSQQFPNNYGWYQCRWHTAAGNIFDKAGMDAIKNYGWF